MLFNNKHMVIKLRQVSNVGFASPASRVRIRLNKCSIHHKQVNASKETRTIVRERNFNITRTIC